MGTVAAWILHKKSPQARQVYPPANTQGNDQTGPCACRKHFNFPFPMHLTLNGGERERGRGKRFPSHLGPFNCRILHVHTQTEW